MAASVWNNYLSQHPDVLSEYNSESTRDAKSKENLVSIGAATPEKYAEWHYNNYGKSAGWTLDDPSTQTVTPAANTGLNDWLTQQNATRTQQANAYNQQVSAWKQQAQGYQSGLAGLWNTVSGLKLGDDLSGLQGMAGQARNFTSALSGLRSQAPSKLNLSPFGTYNGQVQFLDTPQLEDMDYSLLSSDSSGLLAAINGLLSQETQEKARVSSYYNNAISNFNRSDINYKSGSLNRDWDTERSIVDMDWADLNNFETPLASYSNEYKTKAQKEYDELLGILDSRSQQKTAETGRLTDFETQMRNSINALTDQFSGMSIRDLNNPNDYKNQIRALQSQLTGFRTDLDKDTVLGDEYDDLGFANSSLLDLIGRRQSEEAAVREAQNRYKQQAYGFSSAARQSNMYDMYGIQNLEDQIAMSRDNMMGEQFELDSDWTSQNALFEQALASLTGLKTNRTTALAKERSDVDALAAQIPGTEIWDDTKLNQLRTGLDREYSDLGRFTGGTDEQYGYLDTTRQSVEDLLNQLQTKRSGLESTGQDILSRVKRGSFYTSNDVDAYKTEAQSLYDELTKYKASQGMDEYDEIERLLGLQSTRLTNDIKTSTDRDAAQAAATRKNIDAGGNLRSEFGVSKNEVMTEAQLMALLAGQKDDASGVPVSYSSSFASNLGL